MRKSENYNGCGCINEGQWGSRCQYIYIYIYIALYIYSIFLKLWEKTLEMEVEILLNAYNLSPLQGLKK